MFVAIVTTPWITSSTKLIVQSVISQDALTVGLSQHVLNVMKASCITWIRDHAFSVIKVITSSKTLSVRNAS